MPERGHELTLVAIVKIRGGDRNIDVKIDGHDVIRPGDSVDEALFKDSLYKALRLRIDKYASGA